MSTISLCMIVKNEEKVLGRCLESAKQIADEIVIVDTGSSDATKEIAKKYTNKIFDFEWVNDFSAARNFAFSKAVMDYQMWLDADDILPQETIKGLLELKKTLGAEVDIVAMKYIAGFDENGMPVLSSTRERLLRREKGYVWLDPVHECIPLVGNVHYSSLAVYHKPVKKEERGGRNLKIYCGLEQTQKELTPRQQYYFARELKDNGKWEKAVFYFEKFLNSGLGWFENNIETCFALSICYNVLKNENKILPVLIKSFEFDAPRAEICCEIGYYYKRAKNFVTALKWFKLAANLQQGNSAGFLLCDYWGYIPNIEACVCCCALSDLKTAYEFNETAAKFKPNSAAVLHNRKFISEELGI